MATVEHEVKVDVPAGVDETSEALLRTAEICRERWVRCSFGGNRGDKHCVRGAIWEVAGMEMNEIYINAVQRLRLSLGLSSEGRLISWNDNLHRTKEDVIEALERAAYGL